VAPLRILYGHCYTPATHFGIGWIEAWLGRLRAAGIQVKGIQLGLNIPGRRLTFRDLDRRWRRGDRDLMQLYERVALETESADVLVNAGALNLHPDFLAQLPVTTVLSFNDDPESNDASRPVAGHHDLCMIGNIAEVETYRAWGVRHVEWWPMGFRADDYDASTTEDQIITKTREVDVALLCERLTSYRRARVDKFALSFPQGQYYGAGWPSGFLPEAQRVPLLQRTKIGVNIHNSTGPINFRTYYLPANGTMQICDNKHYLGGIFDLGVEVIGYDTIEQAIELCRYYLAHDEERRAIALAGWRRALRDYNEVAVFKRLEASVLRIRRSKSHEASDLLTVLASHVRATRRARIAHRFIAPITGPMGAMGRLRKGIQRRLSRWWSNTSYKIKAARTAQRG